MSCRPLLKSEVKAPEYATIPAATTEFPGIRHCLSFKFSISLAHLIFSSPNPPVSLMARSSFNLHSLMFSSNSAISLIDFSRASYSSLTFLSTISNWSFFYLSSPIFLSKIACYSFNLSLSGCVLTNTLWKSYIA